MDGNPKLLIHGCNFITQKGDKSNNLNQILSLVHYQFMHASCNPPPNCIILVCFWKILDIKKVQQFV